MLQLVAMSLNNSAYLDNMDMNYSNEIQLLISTVNKEIVDLNIIREHSNPPTQASSEFLTNKEQGDWAEQTLMKAINEQSIHYHAVKYGRGDDCVAGDPGFADFYESYQNELDEIGKRPDLLIFERGVIDQSIVDISKMPRDYLDSIVPKAKCGIEVRSSAFLINKYDKYMADKVAKATKNVFDIKETILGHHSDLLKRKDRALFDIISNISGENIHVVEYRSPSWRSTPELSELSSLLKEMKHNLKEIQKRDFLSITPKIEDLKVVYNWIQKYNVPHYYVQVFFDRAYGISYKNILELLNDEAQEGGVYFIESDVKNQNKTTIKIRANYGKMVLSRVELPSHYSVMKELARGRLLFYVKFRDSLAAVSKDELNTLVGFDLI